MSWQRKKLFLVFELNNTQSDLAKCLEFILTYEHKSSYSDSKQTVQKLMKLSSDIDISNAYVKNNFPSPRYFEQPMIQAGAKETVLPLTQEIERITEETISNIVHDDLEVRYHVRIHQNCKSNIQNENIVPFQYLALMLQKLEFLFEEQAVSKKRLSVFIVPYGSTIYPFANSSGEVDYSVYDVVSQYLRLLSKEYFGIIYGVDKVVKRETGEISPVVTALDFKDTSILYDYIPLVPIDSESYHILFDSIPPQMFQQLLELKKNRRFGQAADKNPKIALHDFIAETAVHKFQDAFSNSKMKGIKKTAYASACDAIIKEFAEDSSNDNLITFAIFSFIISKDSERLEITKKRNEEIENALEIARRISAGVKQAVQNVIQHSETKTGFFSFYMHRCERDVFFRDSIGASYQIPEDLFPDDILELSALEVFVSDLNFEETIPESFVKNLQKDLDQLPIEASDERKVYTNLIDKVSNIAVRNFFDELDDDDPMIEWNAFRALSSSAHIGLKLFLRAVNSCNASLKVQSAKTYGIQDKKLQCYRNNKNDNALNTREDGFALDTDQSVIPGVQFSILIPIMKISKKQIAGIAQLGDIVTFDETYSNFAKFLESASKEVLALKRFEKIVSELSTEQPDGQVLNIKNNTDKWSMVKKWEGFFSDIMCECNVCDKKPAESGDRTKTIHYIDFAKDLQADYLYNSDNAEVFIKGVLNVVVNPEYTDITEYFAIINTSPAFFQLFRQILSTFHLIRRMNPNLQFFIHEKDACHSATLFGETVADVIRNEYILGLEHGLGMFSIDDFKEANEYAEHEKAYILMPFDTVLKASEHGGETIFDNKIKFLSEKSLDDPDESGYKIANTHMRLGSKVHIEGFYEMAFLFYRTSVANRFAFEILRNLLQNIDYSNIDLKKDKIIFYGYASYSKAILTSIIEMLNVYRELNHSKESIISYVAYQHNLQLYSHSDEIQMYFGYKPPEKNGFKIIESNTKIIQIVPISSTLTTFKKMWSKFSNAVRIESVREGTSTEELIRITEPAANYTIFWVRNNEETQAGKPSELEETYWDHFCPENRVITTNLISKEMELESPAANNPIFFIQSTIRWHDPLKCEHCYPKNLLMEMPLVETDQTSTVPTQQIRLKSSYRAARKADLERTNENNQRLMTLYGNVYYGHIRRGKNDFQYYIDTQNLFHSAEHEIKKWLEAIKSDSRNHDEKSTGRPVLNIIFAPEHHTNVGFAQYVNTYYFSGTAEVISINVDKEYRSNFICEHTGIIKTIEQLLGGYSNHDNPIRFHFVDDAINTGGTFQRANSLLRTLIPYKFKHAFSVNIFDKCFVLVDRLSDSSKNGFVFDAKKNYFSFLHIDVSSIRTQGDSCIGCKLQQDAKKLFKRSSTNELSHYWARKTYDYRPIAFDDVKTLKSEYETNAASKLIVSHIAQNVIFIDNNFDDEERIYDSILELFLRFLGVENKTEMDEDDKDSNPSHQISMFDKTPNAVAFNYSDLVNKMFNKVEDDGKTRFELLKILVKVISRPFFTYDFKVKSQILNFFLIMTEGFWADSLSAFKEKLTRMNLQMDSKDKSFLQEPNCLERTINVLEAIQANLTNPTEKIVFLRDYLLEPLADMRSTYLLRVDTMRNAASYFKDDEYIPCEERCKKTLGDCNKNVVECFWRMYTSNVHKIIDCNSDETKALWFEHVLTNGVEYADSGSQPSSLFDAINGGSSKWHNQLKHFCNELFLMNTGMNFDCIKNQMKQKTEVDDYFNKNYVAFRALANHNETPAYIASDTIDPQSKEKALYKFLNPLNGNKNNGKSDKGAESDGLDVVKRNEDLLDNIKSMLKEKHGFEKVNAAIVVYSDNNTKNGVEGSEIQYCDMIAWKFDGILLQDEIVKKREIKELIVKDRHKLLKTGNSLLETQLTQPQQIVIYFDNPVIDFEDEVSIASLLDREVKKIAQVFLYLDLSGEVEMSSTAMHVIRDILTYRDWLLHFFENDFAGDIYAKYARSIGEKNILAHEKTVRHASAVDDEEEYELLTNPQEQFKMLFTEDLDANNKLLWLIFRTYTNSQIAKLFNRCFLNEKNDAPSSHNNRIPSLFPKKRTEDHFGKKIEQFNQLEILKPGEANKKDMRAQLLGKIIALDIAPELKLDNVYFVGHEENEAGYNLEYFTCVLTDIFFSAIKHLVGHDKTFMQRVQKLYDDGTKCQISLMRKPGKNGIDYLVIRNAVDKLQVNVDGGIDFRNECIKKRMEDPLEHADGHISLISIKRYIEGLTKGMNLLCEFEYMTCDQKENRDNSEAPRNSIYFETRLPVLKAYENREV